MRIMVIGRNGQLAGALAAAAPDGCVLFGRDDIDIFDADALAAAIRRVAPAAIVNTAAWTAVDAAETQTGEAFSLNVTAARMVAEAAAAAGVPLLHLSTDYVFDGNPGRPWREDDPLSPKSVYGRSKVAGEKAVLETGARALVIRTSWIYSATGSNFLLTMLRLGARQKELRVVDDQTGGPTYAGDLAGGLLRIAARFAGNAADAGGVLHLAAAGSTTWHGLALAIFSHAARRGWPVPASVLPVSTAAFGAPAPRPAWSVLDCSRARERYAVALPEWRDGVARCIASMAEPPQDNASGS
ncbi:MAG: dTDP-4-dehydrorhamnose reductase [Flavobacteriaceae bacterium]